MMVVSFVLMAVAFIIARTTEASLVDRVDQQLVQAGTQLPPPDAVFGTGGGTPVMFVGPTSVYAWRIEHGVIRVLQQPNVTTGGGAGPQIRVAQAMHAVRTGDAFTVSSTTGSGRYRVMARRVPGAVDVVGLSLHDVDATMSKLRWVLLAAIAIVVGILGVVGFWVLRHGGRPLKRMTKTAGRTPPGDP